MTGDRRLVDCLRHVVEAVDRIATYTRTMDRSEYLATQLAQDAVIRNLEIFGEASRNVVRRFPDLAAQHGEIPFASAYEMRNALSHGYFAVDQGVVWTTIQSDLPLLRKRVLALLAELQP